MRLVKKCVAAVSGAAMLLTGASSVAEAAEPGNIVTFGDSYTANPDELRNSFRWLPLATDNYPFREGCLQAPNNWPRKLAAKTNRPLADWSCTAQTSNTMNERLDRAIAEGDVRNDTTVVIAVGMNDYGPFNAKVLTSSPDFAKNVQDNYLNRLREAADKIRHVAPEAKIVLSGALPTVDREHATLCAVNVTPNHPGGIFLPVLRDVENWNRDNQIRAAHLMGASYVDMIDGARGHDTCAPDAQRWVAGIIDTTTPDYNMAIHPTDSGSEYIANTLAPHV